MCGTLHPQAYRHWAPKAKDIDGKMGNKKAKDQLQQSHRFVQGLGLVAPATLLNGRPLPEDEGLLGLSAGQRREEAVLKALSAKGKLHDDVDDVLKLVLKENPSYPRYRPVAFEPPVFEPAAVKMASPLQVPFLRLSIHRSESLCSGLSWVVASPIVCGRGCCHGGGCGCWGVVSVAPAPHPSTQIYANGEQQFQLPVSFRKSTSPVTGHHGRHRQMAIATYKQPQTVGKPPKKVPILSNVWYSRNAENFKGKSIVPESTGKPPTPGGRAHWAGVGRTVMAPIGGGHHQAGDGPGTATAACAPGPGLVGAGARPPGGLRSDDTSGAPRASWPQGLPVLRWEAPFSRPRVTPQRWQSKPGKPVSARPRWCRRAQWHMRRCCRAYGCHHGCRTMHLPLACPAPPPLAMCTPHLHPA